MHISFAAFVLMATSLVIGLICAFAMAGAFTSQMKRQNTKTKKGEYNATAILIGFKSMLMFLAGMFVGAFGTLVLMGPGVGSPSELLLSALASALAMFLPIFVSASMLASWTHGKEFPPSEFNEDEQSSDMVGNTEIESENPSISQSSRT